MSFEKALLNGIKRVALDALEEIKNAASGDDTDWINLDPAEKIRIIRAMGFTPHQDPHDIGCPKVISSGYRCNCIPPPATWWPPRDVEAYDHKNT